MAEKKTAEWLAIAQYKYLHEPEFHAMVEYVVQERMAKFYEEYRQREASYQRELVKAIEAEHEAKKTVKIRDRTTTKLKGALRMMQEPDNTETPDTETPAESEDIVRDYETVIQIDVDDEGILWWHKDGVMIPECVDCGTQGFGDYHVPNQVWEHIGVGESELCWPSFHLRLIKSYR